ncbi:MAG TPA: thermonuclease family protein [Solirubrobacterales bacterium]|jgi:micrococcal nuclease|nr:thermonuclease family protein [Solirubrobacterales bacterium]
MSSRTAVAWVALFALLIAASFNWIDTGTEQDVGDDGHVIYPTPSGQARAAPAGKSDLPASARVTRVVDGDTIVVSAGGRTHRVRYIGVDTPETVKPNAPVECFGNRASKFNHELIEGKTVKLVPDREPRDRYGRALAYVYLGDRFVNAELVKRGLARTLEIDPNTSKASYLAQLERVAIRTNKGLWGACDR